VQVRIGLPTSFRRFAQAARRLGAPVLVSANALRRGDGRGFRTPPTGLFSGVPVALDSAGFVAHNRYGGFPWSVAEYVELAAGYPWDWWAQMDLCCEPEVAGNRDEVQRRISETVRLLGRCREEATSRGLAPPMPVLQGWRPGDYLACAEAMGELPPLVGVGSVCRRDVSGRDGILAVLAALDRELPPRTRLHLFGVKGSAIRKLAGHPRIHSVDSMAWDLAARYEAAGRNDLDHRIARMRDWYARQVEALPQEANGRGPAKDPAARWRQRAARERRAGAGLRQVVLWLPEEAMSVLDGERSEGETRSDSARRILAGWVTRGPGNGRD
jgi:hypothetical protein